MQIEPLSPLGAEVRGLDLRDELGPAAVAGVLDAFRHYGLLLFRGQSLDTERQTRFAELFGPLSTASAYIKDAAPVIFLSNTRKDGIFGDGELLFHSDHTYKEVPDIRGIMLYALEVPPAGGETAFVDGRRAYRELPPEIKERIAGLRALHISFIGERGDKRLREADLAPNGLRAIQPMVWPHPETGEEILLVSELSVDRIVDYDPDEGEALLQALFAHLYRLERRYVHKWSAGDLIVWDNYALQHARTPFDPREKRTLRRTPLARLETVAPSPTN